ncbi:MAG: hypothetical protein ACF8PN_08950 [Phycisphaerales bacterium]
MRSIDRLWGRSRQALVTGAVVCSLCASAVAQQRRGGGPERENREERVVEPSIGFNEVGSMVETFTLSPEQAEVLATMYEGYASAYQSGASTYRDQRRLIIEEARETGDWQNIREAMTESSEAWDATRERLESSFYDDVRSMLSPDQLARWETYERDRRRREGTASPGQFAGESIDVITVVETIDLPNEVRATIEPTLNNYAQEFDITLQEREALVERVRGMDFRDEAQREEMAELVETIMTRRQSLRDINLRYAQAIAERLPADQANALLNEFKRQSFPRIYTSTEADVYLDDVERMNSLTEGQREALSTVRGDYEARMADVNDRLAALESQAERQVYDETAIEENPMARFVVGFAAVGRERGGRGGGPFGMSPVDVLMDEGTNNRRTELMTRKRQIVREAIDEAHLTLSSGQQAEAPRPETPEMTESERRRAQMRERMQGWAQRAQQWDRDGDRRPRQRQRDDG